MIEALLSIAALEVAQVNAGALPGPMSIKLASSLMLLGIAWHFITKLSALEEEGKNPSPWKYVKSHPWRILNMLIACEVSIWLFLELDQLNAVTAILTGYTCQSVSDNMRKRAENRMQKLQP